MPGINEPSDVFTLYDMTGDNDTGCWIWKGSYGGRSRTLRPYYQVAGRRFISYRLVYQLVHGVELTSDQIIKHSCDNGGHPVGCGNPAHLSIGTNTENMSEMRERQRHGLTHHAVNNIRRLLDKGTTQAAIAELYGMSRANVSAIATGRSYRDVVADNTAAQMENTDDIQN